MSGYFAYDVAWCKCIDGFRDLDLFDESEILYYRSFDYVADFDDCMNCHVVCRD